MPTPILMPALSPTMEEGTLAKWLVKEGDTVEAGDVIAEIETDKATMEVEAVDEGTIGKIVVAEGTENVAVNNPIAYILEDGESADDIPASPSNGAAQPAPAPKAETETTPASAPATAPAPAAKPTPSADGRIKASPLAKRIAAEQGIDLTAISGTGPRGRIVKRDIEQAAKSPQPSAAPAAQQAPGAAPAQTSQPAPSQAPSPAAIEQMGIRPGTYDEVKLDGMRKTIARRMTEAKQQVPHFPLTIDCEVDKLLAFRKDLNAKAADGAYKISVNDFIIRASALALKKLPGVNASYAGDVALMHHHVDIAVAVAIDGGLITPIIREAENKGLAEISVAMKDLAERARTRKLMPEEYQGGTFSISNLGMFGIREFAAVINQPHGAILAVGAGEQRPVVKDGALAIATVMTCTLSCDHRVVDGALGAQWLQIFKGYIEDPVTMLL